MAEPLVPLSREQCLHRLHTQSIGRIAITHQALPSIVPVNYTVVGTSVVFRTEPDGMLARACQNAVVAFEVDDLDPTGTSGWSVLVVGVAEPLSGSATVRALESGLVSAAGEGRDRFIGVSISQLSGREVAPAEAAAVSL